jgi:hypothetical protein
MPDALLITNTSWHEPPRIRHQIAELLTSHGFRVAFFERPRWPWTQQASPILPIADQVTLVQSKSLLHPQLRVIPPLAWCNAAYMAHVYRNRVRALNWSQSATIINFMHDGAFLRRVFPRQRIVTVVHDDFEAQAHFPWFGHVTRALRDTCQSSDRVLAVSTPLVERMQCWAPCELFLPWAVRPYSAPESTSAPRTKLLFWGSIDTAIDVRVVQRLSEACVKRGPDWELLFVGPTERADRRRRMTRELLSLPRVRIEPATPLDSLPLHSIAAAIIPYGGAPHTRAITMANKTMQLLSRGLPLIISGMPSFLKQPFILPIDNQDAAGALVEVHSNFMKWQSAIEGFVKGQKAEDRLRQLGLAEAVSD